MRCSLTGGALKRPNLAIIARPKRATAAVAASVTNHADGGNMTRHHPLAVRAQTAAAMLDMPAQEFMRLVERGALPPPLPPSALKTHE